MAMSQRLDWSGKEQDKDICGKPLDLESIIQDHLRAGFEETQGQILPILQPLTQSREGHYEDESSSLLYVKSVIRTKADIFMDHAASFICHELRNILYPGPLISIDSYYPSSGYDFVNKAKLPEIQRRMSCILQYQHFQHTLSRIREEKRCGTHEARPGRGDKTRAYDQILQNIHPDWDQQDAAAWSKCRRTYREDTARGARWLRVADKLSFGFIILCGRRIAGQMYVSGKLIVPSIFTDILLVTGGDGLRMLLN
jgi:hypothetical protein